MQLTLPFTIAVYMVRDWEGHISEERVSRLTGLLAAVYSSSSFLTALGWGYLSDHIGRKPVVVFGNVVRYSLSSTSPRVRYPHLSMLEMGMRTWSASAGVRSRDRGLWRCAQLWLGSGHAVLAGATKWHHRRSEDHYRREI